ncbi:MAG: aldose 1-epimerase family protein [Bacteroidota bacterium]
MQILLENESLLIQFSSKGAELTSIKSQIDGVEYLWKADPNIWGRHAPLLFPIVGRLKENQYQYKGDTYGMNQHGFVRDQDFQVIQQTPQSIWFELNANDFTLAQYPFHFRLRVGYELEEATLRVVYEVANLGNGLMPFSIGAHPGFSCPMVAGEVLEDYVIEFDQEEQADTHLLNDKGLFDGRTRPCLAGNRRIPITSTLFLDDALVFHHLNSSSAKLLSLRSGRYVEVSIKGFPFLGIWAKPGAPYVCIEPWHGLADLAETSGDIFEKKGIYTLNANRTFSCDYTISCR